MSLEASDDLDGSGFEESKDVGDGKRETAIHNDKYDVALEVSASNDLSEPGAPRRKELLLRNSKFDEALDVSASMDMPSADFGTQAPLQAAAAAAARPSRGSARGAEEKGTGGGVVAVRNDQFDATLDVSSGEDESSVDTRSSEVRKAPQKRSLALPGDAPAGVRSSAGSNSGGGSGGTPASITAGDSAALPGGGAVLSGRPAAASSLNAGISSGAGIGGASAARQGTAAAPTSAGLGDSMSGSEEESSGSEETDEEEEGGGGRGRTGSIKVDGAYNPEDYARLNVSAEIKDLFQYIQRYKPHEVDLDTTLRCFVPDYIPTVGEMDAFLKVPRPDADTTPDDLGLKVLDEPAASQSDATVLELQLRAVSKRQHGDVAVRSIEDAAKNPAEIDRWIASIADLHRTKPPPQVTYKRSMPEVDALMEAWPPEMEEYLASGAPLLPPPDVELSLEEYCRAACALLDVPVHDTAAGGRGGGGLVESLHLLFTVYMEFQANQHFQGGGAGMAGNPGSAFMGSSYK